MESVLEHPQTAPSAPTKIDPMRSIINPIGLYPHRLPPPTSPFAHELNVSTKNIILVQKKFVVPTVLCHFVLIDCTWHPLMEGSTLLFSVLIGLPILAKLK
jgi:hypothetical protein